MNIAKKKHITKAIEGVYDTFDRTDQKIYAVEERCRELEAQVKRLDGANDQLRMNLKTLIEAFREGDRVDANK